MKFEPGLSDRSDVTSDDDRSSETSSSEELSELEPTTYYKKIDLRGASLDVSEEYRKAIENESKSDEGSRAHVPLTKSIEEGWKPVYANRKAFFAREGRRRAREEREKLIEEREKLIEERGDTTVATGPGKEYDWIDSLLSKLSVRGIFSQILPQSPPTGTRRWSFKSPLSALGLGECLLEGGKTRVRWRCVCGRKMYDDFIELRPGAAADLERLLNHSIRNHAANRASNPSQDYTLRSSNASSAGVSGQRQTAGSDISLQPLSWTASRMPDSDKDGAVTIDVHLEKCWLLICGQPRRGPDSLLAQLDLSSKPSDKELFDSLKELHSSLRNTFTLQPVLKGVRTIRFVQASFEN